MLSIHARFALWIIVGCLSLAAVMVGGLDGNTPLFVVGLTGTCATIFCLGTGIWLEGSQSRK